MSVLLKTEVVAKAEDVLGAAALTGLNKTAKGAVPTEALAAIYFMLAGKQH